MFWPRTDTKVFEQPRSRGRVSRMRRQMDAQCDRLQRMYPYAISTTSRRISAPLALFSLPSRVEHAWRGMRRKS
jgi:hypothetical protein